ncbi:ABC transporter ATP-binding protein [Solidesulfovibrio carbinolicus]|uniref:ABC transporter ATP-binding protein n=1 Tax=Solidesulfovibrio carbinolicus TaxID=296842 RepID=UPI001011B437|nr:ABC transporter ATP-binding protein [Solidesulfovibrio carbinolicus]
MKLQDIIDFTELGEFINFPVKTYSAGMATRLSFAVATAIEPEILVLDEGIGAGDARFIRKAQERAKDLYKRTDIMIIASHDEPLIRSFCNKAILLERGKIKQQGSVDEIISAYNSKHHINRLSKLPLDHIHVQLYKKRYLPNITNFVRFA